MEKINPIIVIPSRLAATRLPNKPLLDIAGLPMIIQVVKRAQEADVAPILVATADDEILQCVKDYGVEAVLTNKDLPSGTDRINQALNFFDKELKYNTVINLQGDLPTIEKDCVVSCLSLIKDYKFKMATIGAIIDNDKDKTNPNVVKAVLSFLKTDEQIAKALYFTRATAPWGEGDLYHHIGIYGYTRDVLLQLTKLAPSPLEKREKLEQLRALENNIEIGFKVVKTVPLGVDTKEDLEKANLMLRGIGA